MARSFELQLLDLFDQQGNVLQQVCVLLQQPLHSGLGFSPSTQLHRQLFLQNIYLNTHTDIQLLNATAREY